MDALTIAVGIGTLGTAITWMHGYWLGQKHGKELAREEAWQAAMPRDDTAAVSMNVLADALEKLRSANERLQDASEKLRKANEAKKKRGE